MKIALISDLHFGVSNDSPLFMDESERFFRDFFFPYLRKNGIRTIINAGDTFDKRRLITYSTMERVKNFYFEVMNKEFELHTLVGNHDCPYRNTNFPNSVELLAQKTYPNISVYSSPTDVVIAGEKFCMIPWINPENHDESLEVIKKSDAAVLIGHLEIAGFTMLKGILCKDGLSEKMFKKFERVVSGHFHYRSNQNNIDYIGNPHETTWADYGNTKGFHVLDLKTREMEFVENPRKIYFRYSFNSQNDIELPKTFENKIVHIEEVHSDKEIDFERFRKKVEALHPFKLTTKERDKVLENEGKYEEDEDIKTIEDIMVDYIDRNVAITNEEQRKKLFVFMKELLKEAEENV